MPNPISGALPLPTTAATTSRLGLMNPVDSDLFKSGDYASTFQILDAMPGTYPVANYAALQALTWTTAQHGTRVLQLDNGAEWYWYQPSGQGVWKRTNSIGLITWANSTAAVGTTTIGTGPTFVQTPQFTAPGGRHIRIGLRVGADNNNGLNGVVIVTIKDNGVTLLDWNIRCGSFINGNGVGYLNELFLINPVANSTHRISASVRSANMSTANGGKGNSVIRASSLTVTEV